MKHINFENMDGLFSLEQPENYSGLYFPVAGEKGLKGSVTPNFAGDSKLNQNAFLMEPVSVDDLHNRKSGRNFWCYVEGKGSWSAVGLSAEEENQKFTKKQDASKLTAGFMWQTVERESVNHGLKAKVTSFVPVKDNVEIFSVQITNTSNKSQIITPTAAIPIYGRSADNIRDHRHVTSLLHRIRTTDYGVYVRPTLSFDERGHQKNELTYFVCGVTGSGESPEKFYPTVSEFIGEGGSLMYPGCILEHRGGVAKDVSMAGEEALGGIGFADVELAPGESKTYTLVMGITNCEEEIEKVIQTYDTAEKVEKAKQELNEYWQKKVNVRYHTGNKEFDNYMRWVSFQPILRRIYGCSFLPHHDYGRGGRGWRDLWQDCLSLLIMDPTAVRQMILDNYGGVRIDGTNATIIGEKQGEFIADRNGIARVWMDHGVWPFITTKLYIDQTGDVNILKEDVAYFKDEQCERGTSLDEAWNSSYGLQQKDKNANVYKGSILEHLILQHLCAFYEVGSHNHMRLRGADWNDALDMAAEHGESVAFTCAYAGNLAQMAELLKTLKNQFGWKSVKMLKEVESLMDAGSEIYDDITAKQELLKQYVSSCKHNISGQYVEFDIEKLADNLQEKADWIREHVRNTEWIEDQEKHPGEGWFNSYYDNDKNAVEGYFEQGVRMMLTGQVFAIMSKTAKEEQVERICQSADQYLYKKEVGGYRLNTDFKELKLNLGRMFGFAYGEKENGAVFSHMTVMYANALYQRGFVGEGYKALQTLADTALDFETSKIYPGIPEYFDSKGRGLYHYLTGAASWYMLTMITEVFGVRGEFGHMIMRPKLVKEQFDAKGNAELELQFADKRFHVVYHNPKKLAYGEYQIKDAVCDGQIKLHLQDDYVTLDREQINLLSDTVHTIEIELK